MVLLYLFSIGGNDLTSFVKEGTAIDLNRKATDGNSAKIIVDREALNSYSISAGDSVVISRGETTSTDDYIFRGKVNKVEYVGRDIELTARDSLNDMKFQYFTKSFDKNIDTEAGVISEIWTTIVEDGGFTASAVSSADFVALNKFIAKDNTRLERLNTLVKILDWSMYEDYNNQYIRLEPKGFNVTGITLSTTSNIYNNPVWEEDLDTMRNSIKIKGAYDEDTRIEFFNGDNSTTEFTLTSYPLITEVEHPINTLLVRGVPDASTTYDYFTNYDTKVVAFVAAPSSGTNNVKVKYTTKLPRPVQGVNQSSIDRYGITKEAVYTFDDIVSVEDAESRLQKLLSVLSVAKVTTTLETTQYGLKPNDVVTVEDAINTQYSGDYLVHGVQIKYPTQFDIVKIGDVEFDIQEVLDTISERLSALEQKELPVIDILRQIKTTNRTINYQRRSAKFEKIDRSGQGTGVFILGNDTFGKLGTNKLGDDGNYTTSTVSLIPGNNTFKEFIYDTEYDGSGTATWDTGNNKITFTSGQTRTTDDFAIGVAYTSFNVTLASTTGTILTEISGDGGSTWQTVTLETTTAFTSSDGTGVRLRFTENAALPAEIATTKKDDGSYNLPAITVVLTE